MKQDIYATSVHFVDHLFCFLCYVFDYTETTVADGVRVRPGGLVGPSNQSGRRPFFSQRAASFRFVAVGRQAVD